MNNEERLIIENQLKSFTRFVLESKVEDYLKIETDNQVMKGIAEATKKYKEDIRNRIEESMKSFGIPKVYESLLKISNTEIETNINACQYLVNQFVKDQFGGY